MSAIVIQTKRPQIESLKDWDKIDTFIGQYT